MNFSLGVYFLIFHLFFVLFLFSFVAARGRWTERRDNNRCKCRCSITRYSHNAHKTTETKESCNSRRSSGSDSSSGTRKKGAVNFHITLRHIANNAWNVNVYKCIERNINIECLIVIINAEINHVLLFVCWLSLLWSESSGRAHRSGIRGHE